MYLQWTGFAEILGVKPGIYNSFYKGIYLAKKLGLVRAIREERGEKGTTKVYYELTRGSERREEWLRLWQSVYPSTDWTGRRKREYYDRKYYIKR